VAIGRENVMAREKISTTRYVASWHNEKGRRRQRDVRGQAKNHRMAGCWWYALTVERNEHGMAIAGAVAAAGILPHMHNNNNSASISVISKQHQQ